MRVLIPAALALPLALPAFAQQPAPQPITREALVAIDTNGDGKVSREELIAAMSAAFQQLDTDKNGSLSEPEALVVIPLAQFRAADRNANGQLSKDEYIAVVIADFKAADRNGDGSLD